jgi:hypothetical protein
MGYRDDFYIKDNILGYTGTIGKDPTVYFADAGGTAPRLAKVNGKDHVLVTFGHITQFHDIADNIGRGAVMESTSYSIYNNAQGFAEECIYGPRECDRLFGKGAAKDLQKYGEAGVTKDGHYIFHPSRNLFIPVNKGTIDSLAEAIRNFTAVKEREK